MTLRIEMLHGAEFVAAADIDRALAAAEAVLGAGDAQACEAAFYAAVEDGLDPRAAGELASRWDRAASAANIALTAGWSGSAYDLEGVSCELRA